MQKIVPHLWYDKEASEAAEFYMSLFEGSRLIDKTILNNTPSGTAELLTIEMEGQEFMLISAGPYFKFTPAVSFVISCSTLGEVDKFWNKFIEEGIALMPIGTYPFSERYGWVCDKYGLSWQIMYASDAQIKQKITPALMFVGDQYGKAEEAINFYTTTFKNSKIENIDRYGEGDEFNKPDTIMQVKFILENLSFSAMDSGYKHNFTFNEAISFVVNCDDQEEIDYFWNKLSAVPEAEQCGWIKDKYGLSWQITPTVMSEMMQNKDAQKMAQLTEAFLKMKKFDIAELIKAYER
ncbi:VOC family protein [Clostridium sp. 'White wine YQ']|uniref:VOC family protein n=1 Tax=Clostridium sp. 'White wine YQ' TaxID=3027474 RepID=UPI0023654E26|nr:VOC family protein [Clostridium sp. 'White wine YQ']MDD7794252.1 VOC family protein [Clostridium sp. 'White wine YQ']